MTDYTPTPWSVEGGTHSQGWRIHARQGPIVVCPAVAYGYADARFITRAVNAYGPLLEALKMARQCIAYCRKAHSDVQSGDGFPVEVFIDAAIAKAEAEQ